MLLRRFFSGATRAVRTSGGSKKLLAEHFPQEQASPVAHVIDLSTTTAPPRFLLAKLGVVGAAGLGLGAAGASYMAKVLDEDLGWFHYVPEDDDDDDEDEDADAAKKADDDDKDDEDDSGRDKKGNGKDKTSNNTIGVQFAGIGDLPLDQRATAYLQLFKQLHTDVETVRLKVPDSIRWERHMLDATAGQLQRNLAIIEVHGGRAIVKESAAAAAS